MYDLTDINTIKKLLSAQGFNFSKALGQNFLIDPTVCPRMAEKCGVSKDSSVLEIGAGVGVLTAELAKTAKKVLSLEVDARLLPVLAKTLDGMDNVSVVNADIMKADLGALISEHLEGDVYVCSNLPYYITSPILMLLLESGVKFKAMTLMVQKEAAERICAPVGGKDCGALTAAVNYRARAEYLFDVGRSSFLPPPNVDSAVIKLTLRDEPAVNVRDEKLFFRVIKSAFAQRRKTAANSLAAGLGKSKAEITELLTRAGISPGARAETFTLEQFALLTEMLLG